MPDSVISIKNWASNGLKQSQLRCPKRPFQPTESNTWLMAVDWPFGSKKIS
jgi:hypothetical protein